MKMDIPSPVLHSLFTLNQAGYQAYAVGGCVRDSLLGKQPQDWDITTSALPQETAAIFADYRTLDVGLKHGTVTVFVEDMPLEITTYRVDGIYSDGRHPDCVVFTPSLEEDLKRRDFTINAMAYHPKFGLVDPFGGRQDLDNRCICCVGDPERRFSEDALRIIRGLRFAATLGFAIEENTARAIHQLAPLLEQVAIERIAVELLKLLRGPQADRIVVEYGDVLELLFPHSIDWTRAAARLTMVKPDTMLRLGVLLFDTSPPEAKAICRHLRLSNDIAETVVDWIAYKEAPFVEEHPCIARLLNRLGEEKLHTLIELRCAVDGCDYRPFRAAVQAALNDSICYRISDLEINGTDLQSIGVPTGPILGQTLNALLDAVMDEACPNERDALLEYAKINPVQ